MARRKRKEQMRNASNLMGGLITVFEREPVLTMSDLF